MADNSSSEKEISQEDMDLPENAQTEPYVDQKAVGYEPEVYNDGSTGGKPPSPS